MRPRTAPTTGIPAQLADHYRDQARRYYPGTIGRDCDGLVEDLVALGPDLDLDQVDDLGDLDPAGWIRKAVRLLAGAPCQVPGLDLVGIAAADPRVLSGRVWTVNPDGTINPADLTGNRPRPSRRVSTSWRDGNVSAAPGGSVQSSRGAPHTRPSHPPERI